MKQPKPKTKKKMFTVYVPVIHSEVYHVEASSPEEALRLVRENDPSVDSVGEVIMGDEDDGFRVKEGRR